MRPGVEEIDPRGHYSHHSKVPTFTHVSGPYELFEDFGASSARSFPL